MDKSYVSMEQKICPICGIKHEYDCGLLLDKRLKDSMERYTVTGYGLCEKDTHMQNTGYIALIVCKDNGAEVSTIKMEDADRTGEIIYMRRHVAREFFNVPDDTTFNHEFIFITEEVAIILKNFQEQSNE